MHPPRFLIPLAQGVIDPVQNMIAFNVAEPWHLSELAADITIEQDNAASTDALQGHDFTIEKRVETGEFDRALVLIGKHGDQNKAMIGRAWALVKEGGDLLVEGAKTDGIDSLIRGIKSLGLTPSVEPKSHGKIVWFKKEAARVGSIHAWQNADAPFTNADGFHVRKGIFSSQNVDKGTAYFLEELTQPLKGKVADFGGGYGVITKAVLARNAGIEALDLYEISSMACECSEANINDDRAHIHWLDVEKAAKEYYDVILSNPPFHTSQKGDPEIGKRFIDAAAKSIRARGTFYMVANKHLPYEHHLRGRFGNVDTIAESKSFKIFKATRPQSKAKT